MYGSLKESGRPDQRFFSLVQARPHEGRVTTSSDLTMVETPLQTGDLLRVFNSISTGKELLTVEVDLEMDKKDYQEYQKDIDRDLWSSMFVQRLPAKLTKKNGVVIDGLLDAFSEQGMEGRVAWSLFDFKRDSYNSLHQLEKGDIIRIFSSVTTGGIEWQGRLVFEETPLETGKKFISMTLAQLTDHSLLDAGLNSVPERFTKTCVYPEHEVLSQLSLYRMPTHLQR